MLILGQASPADALRNSGSWAEHGLAGLVIFALFGIVGTGFWWFLGHSTRTEERHTTERKSWDDQRREDSREQRDWLEKQTDANRVVTDKLSTAVEKLSTSVERQNALAINTLKQLKQKRSDA